MKTGSPAGNGGGSFFMQAKGIMQGKGAEVMDAKKAAETKYTTGEITLRALAQEMQLPLSTISRWCKDGKWVKKKARIARRAMEKAATQAVNKKAKELLKLMEASEEIEAALLAAAKMFRQALTEEETQGWSKTMDGRVRAVNINQIVNAIGRAAETRKLLADMEADEETNDIRVVLTDESGRLAE